MGGFLLGFLAVCLGIPVASFLLLPYPIKLALKIVWKIYIVVAALILANWMLSPLYSMAMNVITFIK